MGSPTAPPPSVGPVLSNTNALAMTPGRTRMRNLMADPEKRNQLWDSIAEGERVSDLARRHNIPYLIFYRYLREQCGDEYAAARAAYADTLIGQNLDLAVDIEEGRVGAPEGKTAAGIRQWYAERADSDTWGQRSSMNVHHTGVIGMHMQALKDFQQEQEIEAEDAEFEEVTDDAYADAQDIDAESKNDDISVPSNIDAGSHPLL